MVRRVGSRSPSGGSWALHRAALAESFPAPPPSSVARPLLLPPACPLAPGAWIDLVALASGSRSRPASTPPLPIPGALARLLTSSHAHPRAASAAAAAAAQPGILSKFLAPPVPAPLARGAAPGPPPALIPKGKKKYSARLDFPPSASFSTGELTCRIICK